LSGFDSLPYKLGKVSGLSVDYRYFDGKTDEKEKLEAVLGKLHDDGVRGSDIVVLGLRTFDASAAATIELTGVSWQIVDGRNDDPGDDRILYFTIHAFKGLESPVVVITGINDIASIEGRSLLYVGMSRAKSHLAVILNRKTNADVQERVRQKLRVGWGS
jgi:superfamily I DNA/RNA helicase